jgi:hypothetical protein
MLVSAAGGNRRTVLDDDVFGPEQAVQRFALRNLDLGAHTGLFAMA